MDTATEQANEPRTGDRPGFDTLFDENFEPMKRLAYLLGADDPENISQEAYGQPVPVRQLAELPGGRIYLATFPETHAGFGYTAKDAAGKVLESAIT